MPTACIQTPGSKISLESERIVVSVPDESGNYLRENRRVIPLHDLERVVMGDSVSTTMPALAEILRRQIPICLIDGRGKFLGAFQPATPHHGAARLRQYQRTLDPEFCLTMAGRIVAAKCYNQRRLLQRVAANRREAGHELPQCLATAMDDIGRTISHLAHTTTLESLRGHEGLAAAKYFAAWATLLPAAFPFGNRSTRPPLNPVNACLSFTSTLIYQEIHSAIHSHGLDASLGIMHATENGRWSLALDLMEPFRPVIAEALTLDLFSHKMLNESHFEPKNGGIYLNQEGRGKLLLQYEKRMERQFMSESAGHRTTLRQQIVNQATLFKAALDAPARFEPFLMN